RDDLVTGVQTCALPISLHPLTGEVISEDTELYVFPATHYVAGPERMERAINGIETELAVRLGELDQAGKLLEAQRLRMRTTYDEIGRASWRGSVEDGCA